MLLLIYFTTITVFRHNQKTAHSLCYYYLYYQLNYDALMMQISVTLIFAHQLSIPIFKRKQKVSQSLCYYCINYYILTVYFKFILNTMKKRYRSSCYYYYIFTNIITIINTITTNITITTIT